MNNNIEKMIQKCEICLKLKSSKLNEPLLTHLFFRDIVLNENSFSWVISIDVLFGLIPVNMQLLTQKAFL